MKSHNHVLRILFILSILSSFTSCSDNSDNSIMNNTTTVIMAQYYTPTLGTSASVIFNFAPSAGLTGLNQITF